jgi:hypothetical protein
MEIKVERKYEDNDNLIFTISACKPSFTCFFEEDKKMMQILDKCKDEVCSINPDLNNTQTAIINSIHDAKEKVFLRVLKNLKSSIKYDLEPKFERICQEIYNWIQDNQKDFVKQWMIEFDPQRTTYYFDNDPQLKNQIKNIPDDKFDDEDDDDSELEDD